MADVTVAQFADVLKVPVDKLLTQLDEAGIPVDGAQGTISEDAKMELLSHLQQARGLASKPAAAPRKVTLVRKQQSELRLASGQGRSRTVNVEVRKKRTYLNRGVLEEEAKQAQDELDRERDGERLRREAEEAALEAKRRAAEQESQQKQEEEQRLLAEETARKQAEDQARKDAEEQRRKAQAATAARKKESERRTSPKYGRKELHVAPDKSGRRRKKKPCVVRCPYPAMVATASSGPPHRWSARLRLAKRSPWRTWRRSSPSRRMKSSSR